MSGGLELMVTTRGKPCLLMDGYRHRLFRKSTRTISWLCLKSEREKCRGMVKTTHHNEVVSRTEHSCTPNLNEIEVKKTLQRCKERVRKETSVPVYKIFQEEFSKSGHVMDAPAYNSAKTVLCAERRKALGKLISGRIQILKSSGSGSSTSDQPSTSKSQESSLVRLSFGCVVNDCINHSSSTTPDSAATYHRFPTNVDHRRRWTRFCDIDDDLEVTSERICSRHFEQQCFVSNSKALLKSDAVPTLHPQFGHVDEEESEVTDSEEDTSSGDTPDLGTPQSDEIEELTIKPSISAINSRGQPSETSPVISSDSCTGLNSIPEMPKRTRPASATDGDIYATECCEIEMECGDDAVKEIPASRIPVPGTVFGIQYYSNCSDEDIKLFFLNVADAVLKFPPHLRAEAKAGVSTLIRKLEMTSGCSNN